MSTVCGRSAVHTCHDDVYIWRWFVVIKFGGGGWSHIKPITLETNYDLMIRLTVQPGVARTFALRSWSTLSLHSCSSAQLTHGTSRSVAQPTDNSIEKLCSALNFCWLQKKKKPFSNGKTYAPGYFLSWQPEAASPSVSPDLLLAAETYFFAS